MTWLTVIDITEWSCNSDENIVDQTEEMYGSDDEGKELAQVQAVSKRANHFAFIDRASQTRQFDIQDTECQTDPPPM